MSNFERDITNHETLNPAMWDENNNLKPAVREHLMSMAKEFDDFLNVPDMVVRDITLSGSSAGFNYTEYSDVDLHLVVDIPETQTEMMKNLYDTKRILYNMITDQRIKGYKVEFYVEDYNDEPVRSNGIYSVLKDTWHVMPTKGDGEYDEHAVDDKVDLYSQMIDTATRSGDLDMVKSVWESLKRMRKSGLASGGELAAENLAYKVLRNRGYVEKILTAINNIRDKELSLESVITEDDLSEEIDIFE